MYLLLEWRTFVAYIDLFNVAVLAPYKKGIVLDHRSIQEISMVNYRTDTTAFLSNQKIMRTSAMKFSSNGCAGRYGCSVRIENQACLTKNRLKWFYNNITVQGDKRFRNL